MTIQEKPLATKKQLDYILSIYNFYEHSRLPNPLYKEEASEIIASLLEKKKEHLSKISNDNDYGYTGEDYGHRYE